MTSTAEEYDVIVLGAGPTGENVADRTVAAGLRTVVVEAELVGGECSYWACMPSKALLRPVAALADARAVAGSREAVGDRRLDAAAVLARRDSFTSHWSDDGQVQWLRDTGIDLVRGHGRLAGERTVTVEAEDGSERVLTARHAVVVCTGSRPVLPGHVSGLADARPWTNREATGAPAVPGRLAVVGGGVVGVEMAAAWRALGSEVVLLVRGGGLLPRMEPFAGELVAEGLRDAGVDVRFGTEVTAVERADGSGPVTLTLGDGERLTADEVLYATGRAPRTADIGLEQVGLKPGAWLDVDDSCTVLGVDGGWLYAAGDVNHRALLTHQGKYQARIAGAAIGARAQGRPLDTARWGAHAASADLAGAPQVVFTQPEVAAVGLTLAAAEEAGLRVTSVDHDLGAVAGASLYGDDYRGRARVVFDLDRQVLVGACLVGPGVAELLHSATVAVVGEVPIDRLWHAVPAYPTMSEVWLRLLEGCRG
ncbi:dihydrolipoamide dehydrogenase [Streptomyces sp. 1114.5]|uniref:dihydrolipoyl dehydrogenase family protein n=1 Tax=unclassified Streptomyces TaxID=2593676 RepID=UPI000BD7F6F2|nr:MULTISPECIES: NAD(P)/FAD-dependent oxidoreductase [unclassified Streptomyces]RKT18708.1 dihydrolipoamide dehydrogenase [Streptomyces sp. 1114.5]SOB84910.1 dihydrolipoamide dehydrogenase [Streptomyces sp. 1331.2]